MCNFKKLLFIIAINTLVVYATNSSEENSNIKIAAGDKFNALEHKLNVKYGIMLSKTDTGDVVLNTTNKSSLFFYIFTKSNTCLHIYVDNLTNIILAIEMVRDYENYKTQTKHPKFAPIFVTYIELNTGDVYLIDGAKYNLNALIKGTPTID